MYVIIERASDVLPEHALSRWYIYFAGPNVVYGPDTWRVLQYVKRTSRAVYTEVYSGHARILVYARNELDAPNLARWHSCAGQEILSRRRT